MLGMCYIISTTSHAQGEGQTPLYVVPSVVPQEIFFGPYFLVGRRTHGFVHGFAHGFGA